MEDRDCQSLGHLLRDIGLRYHERRERLNLYAKIHICLYMNYTDIFNFGTRSGFHLTEQDTGGKTFFMAM